MRACGRAYEITHVKTCVKALVKTCDRAYVRAFMRAHERAYVRTCVRALVGTCDKAHVRALVRAYVRERENLRENLIKTFCVGPSVRTSDKASPFTLPR